MFNIKPKVRPPMPTIILNDVRKEIKTVVEPYYEDFGCDEFDEKVNAAIADGYKLTKRTVIVPHNEREKTFFYAELEKINLVELSQHI